MPIDDPLRRRPVDPPMRVGNRPGTGGGINPNAGSPMVVPGPKTDQQPKVLTPGQHPGEEGGFNQGRPPKPLGGGLTTPLTPGQPRSGPSGGFNQRGGVPVFGGGGVPGTVTGDPQGGGGAAPGWVPETMGTIPGYRNTATGQWVDANNPLWQQQPGATGGAPAGGQGVQSGSIDSILNGGQQQPNTIAGAFQHALMQRLTASSPDVNNPAIAGSLAANRTAESRSFARDREMLAERRAAQGLGSSGAADQDLRQLSGDRALRESTYEGNAVQGLAQQQAQELTQALALGGNMLSEQDRMAMQERLAQLDAQLRREGLSVQSQLGQGDLNLRGELGRGGLNLGLLQALLGNQQFGQNLGAQLGMFGANLNQDALMRLLGGLG